MRNESIFSTKGNQLGGINRMDRIQDCMVGENERAQQRLLCECFDIQIGTRLHPLSYVNAIVSQMGVCLCVYFHLRM
ncbi:hypothetical protein RHMOL_Rhmol09G0022400 [Rhododendron molle]|uniref:Uncharacterized protein n=1 Tax=Rhododendron molle TaxID=49168 RepID=A0ACC0MA97_RHOML|nr:hypothetical protein RHMOL_Rhmol09G0022400 [Rhododendron molle]